MKRGASGTTRHKFASRCSFATKDYVVLCHTFWNNWPRQPLPAAEGCKRNGHLLDFGEKAWACERCGREGRILGKVQCQDGKRRGGPPGDPQAGHRMTKRARVGLLFAF